MFWRSIQPPLGKFKTLVLTCVLTLGVMGVILNNRRLQWEFQNGLLQDTPASADGYKNDKQFQSSTSLSELESDPALVRGKFIKKKGNFLFELKNSETLKTREISIALFQRFRKPFNLLKEIRFPELMFSYSSRVSDRGTVAGPPDDRVMEGF